MRKLFFSIGCSFLIIISFAQTHSGFKMGAGIANVPYEPLGHKIRSSFNAGFYTQLKLSGKFHFQPELLYSLKGFAYPSVQSSEKGYVVYHYLNLPLLAAIDLNNNVSIMAGTEIGYLFGSSSTGSTATDVENGVEKFDLGVALGTAFKLSDRLSIDLRYTQGLIKVYKLIIKDIVTGNFSEEKKLGKNQVLHLSLYVIFK
jgi:hypothetical protein